MKNLLIFVFLIFFNFNYSQITDTLNVIIPNIKLSKEEYINNQIRLYTDSLNAKPQKASFIFNPCFDMEGSWWENIHHPTTKSIRWEIIQKIKKKSLKKILKSNDIRLRKYCTCKDAKDIPLIDKSFYDLIEKRYKELKKK